MQNIWILLALPCLQSVIKDAIYLPHEEDVIADRIVFFSHCHLAVLRDAV